MIRRFPLLLASSLVALALSAVGCKQGDGERCQVSSDCNEGLVCVRPSNATISEGGSCTRQSSIDGSANPPIDAAALEMPASDGDTADLVVVPDAARVDAVTPADATQDSATVDLAKPKPADAMSDGTSDATPGG